MHKMHLHKMKKMALMLPSKSFVIVIQQQKQLLILLYQAFTAPRGTRVLAFKKKTVFLGLKKYRNKQKFVKNHAK